MHYALLLPTSQVLVINGGNYWHYGSVHYPLLLTPKFDNVTGAFLDYDKTRMNEAVEPRLYHNTALLLPDGRIWSSGGQASRPATGQAFRRRPVPELGSGVRRDRRTSHIERIIARGVRQQAKRQQCGHRSAHKADQLIQSFI